MAGLVGSGCFRASRRVFCGPKCPAYVRYAVHTHLPLKKAPQIRSLVPQYQQKPVCVCHPTAPPAPTTPPAAATNFTSLRQTSLLRTSKGHECVEFTDVHPFDSEFPARLHCIARRCCSTAAATAAAATAATAAAAAAAAAPPPPRRDVSTTELASAAVGVARRPGRGARERHVRSGEKTGATAERPPKARPRPRIPRTHRSDTLPAPRAPHRAWRALHAARGARTPTSVPRSEGAARGGARSEDERKRRPVHTNSPRPPLLNCGG